MIDSLFIKFILIAFLLYLTVMNYLSPLPLVFYNAKYPFLSSSEIQLFFKIYPFLNILTAIFLLILNKVGSFLSVLILNFYFFYHLQLSINTECAICSANGLLPSFSNTTQNVIFSLFAALSLIYFLMSKSSKKNKI